MMQLMEVRGLTKQYKTTLAVDHIDFDIQEGEVLGFLGPNGAGKSTTINMITSLVAPTAGEVFLRGEDVLANPASIRKILGVVPQEIALYPELSGYENLQFFGRIYKLRGAELKRRIEDILHMIGLEEKIKEKVSTYSGGMKRRLNIGAALLHEPKLLVMDEPTVGIDPQSRNHILETVKQLNKKGMTILYTSHYMEEVEFLCDRIYIMDQGKIIASGTKDELKDRISDSDKIELKVSSGNARFREHLLKHPNVKQVIPVESGREELYQLIVEKNKLVLNDIFKWASEADVEITGLQMQEPTLEDVFLQLTGRALRN